MTRTVVDLFFRISRPVPRCSALRHRTARHRAQLLSARPCLGQAHPQRRLGHACSPPWTSSPNRFRPRAKSRSTRRRLSRRSSGTARTRSCSRSRMRPARRGRRAGSCSSRRTARRARRGCSHCKSSAMRESDRFLYGPACLHSGCYTTRSLRRGAAGRMARLCRSRASGATAAG